MTPAGKIDHSNNFDFIRLIAALAVLFSHQFALMGQPEPTLFDRSAGALAVLTFFSISGFLVTQSWLREPQFFRFLLKRVLRIWPGLMAVGILSALIMGPLVSPLSLREYFSQDLLWRFINDILTIHVEPFDVFTKNPVAPLNGSLWTIPFEMRMYYWWAILGLLGLTKRRWFVPTLAAGIFIYFYFGIHEEALPSFNRSSNYYNYYFANFFLAGACLALFPVIWQKKKAILWSGILTLAVVAASLSSPFFFFYLLLPPLVISVGTKSWPFIRRAGRWGDFSYGIYLYAWPCQQLVIWYWGIEKGYFFLVSMSLLLTLTMAILSWHIVEKRALLLKNISFEPIKQAGANVYTNIKARIFSGETN